MTPKYLRVVVTPRCSLACGFCHMEGDPGSDGLASTELLIEGIRAAAASGVRKVKFLGGEPLLRRDLPDVIRGVRDLDLDLSMITAGVGPKGALDALIEAGLDRVNLSIHGWSEQAFRERTHRTGWARRNQTLDRLLEWGQPLKLNYVYTGPQDEPDMNAFLDACSSRPVVAAILDDLGQEDLDHSVLFDVLVALRGSPLQTWSEPDPNSLPTLRAAWADGLLVELKDHQLGAIAPWRSCATCPVRARCREGIHALRLGHDGTLRTCMDRPDLGVDLALAHRLGRVQPTFAHFLDIHVRRPA